MNIFSRLKRWFNKMRFGAKTIEEALGVRVLSNQKLEQRRELWRSMMNGQAPWNDENTPSLMLPSGICNEISIYTTLELSSDIEGSERAEFLKKQWEPVIENASQDINELLSSDSVMFKPYVRGDKILYKIVTNDCYYILAKNELDEATDVVFGDELQKQVNEEITDYTLLERHTWNEKTLEYKITYKAYESKSEVNRNVSQAGIGKEIPLSKVEEWSDLNPINHYTGFEQPLFVEVKMPKSKSVFDDAVELIKKADQQYGRYDWEFEGSELAIHGDIDLFKNKNAKRGEKPELVLPKGKERLYRKVDFGTPEKFDEFSPQIRDENQARGLNRHKREIERVICLAFGTLSDPQEKEKTAEEVRAGKQRFFVVIQRIQVIMEEAYTRLAKTFDILATVYNLAPIGEYELKFTWGDSIMEDPDKEFNRRLQLVNSGYMKPEYLIAWYFGMKYDPNNQMMVDMLKEIMPEPEKDLADDEE